MVRSIVTGLLTAFLALSPYPFIWAAGGFIVWNWDMTTWTQDGRLSAIFVATLMIGASAPAAMIFKMWMDDQ